MNVVVREISRCSELKGGKRRHLDWPEVILEHSLMRYEELNSFHWELCSFIRGAKVSRTLRWAPYSDSGYCGVKSKSELVGAIRDGPRTGQRPSSFTCENRRPGKFTQISTVRMNMRYWTPDAFGVVYKVFVECRGPDWFEKMGNDLHFYRRTKFTFVPRIRIGRLNPKFSSLDNIP